MQSPDLKKEFDGYLSFYQGRAHRDFRAYVGLKTLELAAASAIPVLAVVNQSRLFLAALGALIAMIEGVLNLLKLQERWISYRKAAEDLRVEGLMWETGSGPYGDSVGRNQVLAERLVLILQEERSEWLSEIAKVDRSKSTAQRPGATTEPPNSGPPMPS